jgi:predicted metal-dependent enzyme (double-stranded beta helix superfamily)
VTTPTAAYGLDSFVADLNTLTHEGRGERDLTAAVAERLRALLASGLKLPAAMTEPRTDKYVMRPLYVAADGSYSIACAVWNVGQKTPVHGHETWGVVGIHTGVEHEVRYRKPERPDEPLEALDPQDWSRGQVTVCCTSDDDVHMVECGSGVPCVGIHVYGADIGTLERRSYDVRTGAVSWFVSRWG